MSLFNANVVDRATAPAVIAAGQELGGYGPNDRLVLREEIRLTKINRIVLFCSFVYYALHCLD